MEDNFTDDPSGQAQVSERGTVARQPLAVPFKLIDIHHRAIDKSQSPAGRLRGHNSAKIYFLDSLERNLDCASVSIQG
jgi:hypothetical protein